MSNTETTVVWHKYPDEKPPHNGEYKVRFDNEETDTDYYNGEFMFYCEVAYWAFMPNTPQEPKHILTD